MHLSTSEKSVALAPAPGGRLRVESGLFGEIPGELRKILELLTGPEVPWWRRWFRAWTLEELARNLCEEANGPAPGYARWGKPSLIRGPGPLSQRTAERYPVLPAVRGKSGSSRGPRKNLVGNPNTPIAGRRKGGLR